MLALLVDFPPLVEGSVAPPSLPARLWSRLSSGLGRSLGLLAGDY
jgi:hypothetical protein